MRILPMIKRRKKKMLLLFTLHVSLDIRQHFNENNNEEKENEGIVTYTNWFIQLLKSMSSCKSKSYVFPSSSRSFSSFPSFRNRIIKKKWI